MLTQLSKVSRDAVRFKNNIWSAGATEDFMVTTSTSGEPIISTMIPTGNEATIASFRPRKGGLTAYQLWQVQKERRDIRAAYLEHWNNTVASTGTERPMDAIICPAAPYAAPPHGQNRSVVLARSFILSLINATLRYANYTTVWNALDYTASIFPVTVVDPAIDVKQPRETFIDAFDKTIYEMCMSSFLLSAAPC